MPGQRPDRLLCGRGWRKRKNGGRKGGGEINRKYTGKGKRNYIDEDTNAIRLWADGLKRIHGGRSSDWGKQSETLGG